MKVADYIVNYLSDIGIEDEFSDMIKKCKGHKPDEKFMNFLSQYFESRGCNVKVKMVND